MAAASDKARFFLEQSVPELKEYERKKIFNREEINSIARKRSDFEHKINARGSTPSDYARYAEFEINVEALRKKRVKRLGVKSTTHNGQRRIFFVFDRGTKKHPGDLGLWLQYIDYTKSCRANKKLTQIFTNVLRLHPTRPELWIYAAQFAMEENGDITEARSYVQRGLRFCKSRKSMWLQYMRLELSYIAKLHARRQVLGIAEPAGGAQIISTSTAVHNALGPSDNDVESLILTTEALKPRSVMAGAIPVTIFDSAMQQFHNDPSLASEFVDVVAEYSYLPAAAGVLRHVRDYLRQLAEEDWLVHACNIQLPVYGVPVTSADFPPAFRLALKALREALTTPELRSWAQRWLSRLASEPDFDPALAQVAASVSKSLADS